MIKIIMFLTSAALFALYCFNEFRPRGILKEEKRPAENRQQVTPAARPGPAADYYAGRLETLYSMLHNALATEKAAADRVNKNNYMNSFGVVIGEKNVSRAEKELYIAQRRRLAIENQIKATETAAEKAGG